MIQIARSVIELLERASVLPGDKTNVALWTEYLQSLASPLARIIVELLSIRESGRLGLIGGTVDLRTAALQELELRGLSVDPALVDLIVAVLAAIVRWFVDDDRGSAVNGS